MRKEVSLIVGGPQGAGLETTAQLLTASLARMRYGVISDREYFSNIVGRHSYIHLRASSEEIPRSLTYPIQIIGAMDHETVFTHFGDIEAGGAIVYDLSTEDKSLDNIPSMEKDLTSRLRQLFSSLGLDGSIRGLIRHVSSEMKVLPVALNYPELIMRIAEKISLPAAQAPRYVSAVVYGAIAALLGLSFNSIDYAIKTRFRERGDMVSINRMIVGEVYQMVKDKYDLPFSLQPSGLDHSEIMVVSGNDSIAMGKIVAGLRFQSYYPITPAADESFTLEANERISVEGVDLGAITVLQTEDEIAAMASAIGAALTGARAATCTSGPGFSLMVEGLGWAGMNEVPVVVTYYQRGGPSTGQPTRGSQSDLLFALHASHGEFPRIVITSGDHLEAFYDSIEAFNLAERYQMPVIHLLDKFLANSIATMPLPKLDHVRIERGKLVKEAVGERKRFDSSYPIPPRYLLGSGAITYHAGDEHDEMGHIDEDPENREKIYRRRMEKLRLADEEVPEEKRVFYYGDEAAEVLLVGWGFVKGVALDAIEELKRDGIRAAYMHLKFFSPFPSRFAKKMLEKFEAGKVISVEHNYLAQAAVVVKIHTDVKIERNIVKYTGRPIYLSELVGAVKKILGGERRVVLTHGP
ncbi:MAG: 2-oxoacid:acceptor oxidoreductase subunit alpha [Nitrososphaeria archaeon]|nr:2-oxoacid:acceptor oxidoreductase subunit alpha [Nitrososphaeria archaeon]